MSSSLVKAHGGSKNLTGAQGQIVSKGMFVSDTMKGIQMSATNKHLSNLVANTIGEPMGRPVMDGVLTDTTQGVNSKDVPELHKTSNKGKTQAKRMGQTPYAGSKY